MVWWSLLANTCSHFAALPALAFIFTTFYVGVKVIIACNTISLNFCALLLIAVDIVPCSWCSIYVKLAAARGDGAGDHVSSFYSHVGHTQGNYSFFSFSFSFVVFALDTSCIRGAISSCMRFRIEARAYWLACWQLAYAKFWSWFLFENIFTVWLAWMICEFGNECVVKPTRNECFVAGTCVRTRMKCIWRR